MISNPPVPPRRLNSHLISEDPAERDPDRRPLRGHSGTLAQPSDLLPVRNGYRLRSSSGPRIRVARTRSA